ncbi:acyltransferase [Paraburkholderia sp.]|uniref:acyltransferase family protein n=1 Tax=Paraburkholderia sp. TaxID=1926495 RepID=UPI0023A34E5B|nr:acyltransferase [Paraburkholderia sp.]MDE1182367.1 acyltransferase [Paraburkholderia sp.]
MSDSIRFQQLDALRGIAALAVVFSHFSYLQPMGWLRAGPPRVLGAGHEAVILFFVLSGFVLTLQLTASRPLGYVEYWIKRVCRIYLPYLAAVALAYGLYRLSEGRDVTWAGRWLNESWPAHVSWIDLARHALFIAPFDTRELNPVLWSLVYEMRISLIFPLVVWAVCRLRVAWSVAIAAALSLIAFVYQLGDGAVLIQASVNAEWMPTLHYLSMFVAGALLALHRRRIVAWFGDGTRWKVPLTIVCLSLPRVMFRAWVPVDFRIGSPASGFIFDWSITPMIVGVIALAISLRPFANALSIKPLLFLGKISYSVYLLHSVVLFTVLHLMADAQPATALCVAAAAIIPVGALAYSLIERPAIYAGKTLAALASHGARTHGGRAEAVTATPADRADTAGSLRRRYARWRTAR